MYKDPKVSVIVPVFNAENYLDDCVKSVIEQTYSNWELILIDDGSSDTSGMLIDNWVEVDKRITCYHFQKNYGVSTARNKGLDMASGDFYSFLDADDELTEDCLELLLKVAIEERADIVSGESCDLNSNLGNSLGGGNLRVPCKQAVWHGTEAIKNSLMDNPFTYSVTRKLFCSCFVDKIRFNHEIKINEDSYFIFLLCCRKPCFIGIDNVVYRYRTTPNSLSRAQFSVRFFDILRVSDLKYKIIEDSLPELIDLALNMKLKARMNLLHNLALQNNKEYSQLERELLLWVRKNKKYYISATSADDKWMFIIEHHLYYLYKMYKRFC